MPNDADSIQLILTDIEGTTSSIAFVKEVLFPYSAKHLSDFVRQHIGDTAIQQQLKAAAAIVKDEGGQVDATDITAMTDILLGWLQQDRKATPLKALQGMIWEAGYRQGDYQAHMYPDATECLRRWHEQDVPLYVYSSGSVRAQELFFGFSQDGDLLPLFSGHFDTRVGTKQAVTSYQKILERLTQQHEIQASNVLFLSDIEAELDAALDAGMQTCWLVRDPATETGNSRHPVAATFHEIEL